MTNTQKKDEWDSLTFLFGLLRCIAAGWITAALLAFLLSAVALGLEDSGGFITPFAYAALLGGSLSCGIFSRGRGWLLTFAAGCAYCASLWLVSLFIGGGEESVGIFGKLLVYLICTAISFIGGTVGCSAKKIKTDGKKSPTVQLRRRMARR